MASPEEREAAAAAQAVADDDALRDALSDMALHFEFSAESHLFSLGFKLPEEAKFAEGFRLFVSACDGVVKLVATCSYRVPAPARPLVGRALLALTNAIPQGSMDMDWDDGELRFRVSWPNIAGARLQPLVKHAVRIGCAAYAVGILAVHEKISQYAAAQAAGSPLPPTDDAAMAEWAGRVATAISEEAYK